MQQFGEWPLGLPGGQEAEGPPEAGPGDKIQTSCVFQTQGFGHEFDPDQERSEAAAPDVRDTAEGSDEEEALLVPDPQAT